MGQRGMTLILLQLNFFLGAYDLPMITDIPVESKHHQMWEQFLAYIHEGKECEKTDDYLFVYNKKFRLGSGDHAQVFIGYSRALRIPVAVKQYKHDADDEVDFTDHLKLAVQCAQGLSEHTNVGRVLGSFITEKRGYFHFNSVGNLYEEPLCAYLMEKKDHYTLMKLAVGFVRGLTFMHKKNIVHTNLKPQNIMVSLSGNVKVVDFGMSRMYIDPSRTTKMEEAPVWQAPEIVLKPLIQHTPSKEADVFSAVLLLFYIFANGRHPLCEKREGERYDFDMYLDNIRSETLIIQLEDHPLHQKLKESIGFNDPKIRPTVDEILTYLERHEPTEEQSLNSACA